MTDLRQLTTDFTEAFNANDIDAIMEFFAEESVLIDLAGERHVGKERIRDALGGILNGIRFDSQDFFMESESGKVLTSWRMFVGEAGAQVSMEGLDVLHWVGGKLVSKSIYGKTEAPRFQPA